MSLVSSLFSSMRPTAGPTFRGGSLSSWIPLAFDGMHGGHTHAGVAMNEQTAMAITAVFRSVALISDAVSMLPVSVYRQVGEERNPEPDHPVSLLLAKPNDLVSSVDLRASTQAHALQYGNGYQDIQRNGRGDPVGLWPLLPDRTRPEAVDGGNGDRRIVYTTSVDGKQHHLDSDDVIHIRGLSFDGLRGYSPLHLARETVGLAAALQEFGAKFFGNDAKSGGFVEHPGTLGKEARKNIRESFADEGGLGNAHRVKVLEEGMKFNATTIAPEDAQFLMTRTFQVEEIARLYGIPLHMLQSHAKSTSWGSGIAQMSLGFLIYTIQPWLTRWEQEMGRKLLTPQELRNGFYMKHNVNALLRADPASRSSFYTAALNPTTGWMSRHEVRALEELNPDDVEPMMPSVPSAPFSFGDDDSDGGDDEDDNSDP